MISDYSVARKYVKKISNSTTSGVVFDLSFTEFKRLIKSKKCRYTGVELTFSHEAKQKDTDVTLDRIDNSKGYVKGNVVACCFAYNQFKAVLENPNNIIGFEQIRRAVKVQEKLLNFK